MDNLSAINDGDEFGRSNPENHLKKLELKLDQGTRASFSNCDINIVMESLFINYMTKESHSRFLI